MADPETVEEAIDQIALGMVSSATENGRQVTQLPLKDLLAVQEYNDRKARSTTTHSIMTSMQAIPPGGG